MKRVKQLLRPPHITRNSTKSEFSRWTVTHSTSAVFSESCFSSYSPRAGWIPQARTSLVAMRELGKHNKTKYGDWIAALSRFGVAFQRAERWHRCGKQRANTFLYLPTESQKNVGWKRHRLAGSLRPRGPRRLEDLEQILSSRNSGNDDVKNYPSS